MSDKNETIEYLTLLVSFITAVSVIAAGWFGYQYRDKWFVNESKVNASIAQMELEMKALRDQLEVASSKASISIDISTLVTEIQPNLTFVQTDYSYKNNVLSLSYEIKNHGRRNVIIDKPIVYLSQTHQYPSRNSEKTLPNELYQVDAVRLGVLSPSNDSTTLMVDIKLKEQPKKDKLYSSVVFHTKTQPIITKIAKEFIGEILTQEELEILASRIYNRHATNSL